MGLYNFKDKYFDYNGANAEVNGYVAFFSPIGNGTGTRQQPKKTKGSPFSVGGGGNVFSSGYHSPSMLYGGNSNNFFIGQGINKTFIDLQITGGAAGYHYFNDMSIKNLTFATLGSGVSFFKKCEIMGNLPANISASSFCLFRVNGGLAGSNNTFVGVSGKTLPNAQLNLFDSCDVIILATDINNYKNNYFAFNNCRLKIGGENDYAALTGDTESDLRQNFVDRCTGQGITVPNITEFGETLPMGRWVFSNNSAIDGLVLKGSTIHTFEQSRLIYFGYTDIRGDSIAITTDTTKAGAFNPNGANAALDVTEGAIAFQSNIDISQPNTGVSDSNIIWLGGKKQLNLLSLIHNFSMQYGVMVDGTPSLGTAPIAMGYIVPYEDGQGRTYLVRSTDDNEAQVVYNGVTYSSVLATLNNIFRGVSGQTSFTPSANAVVYEILDEVMHQTVQARIVNKIPADIITSGNLQAGYWYLVEPNSPSDTTGTVTYNGVTYPAYSSFLVASGTLGFTVNGATHLRRCWRQDYADPADETTDQAFWANEQKPKWFDVLPDDLRCLMKNNNGLSAEMQADADGNYIASGHPDFYNSLLGVNGVQLPAYPVKGTYMQLRLLITTLNPM